MAAISRVEHDIVLRLNRIPVPIKTAEKQPAVTNISRMADTVLRLPGSRDYDGKITHGPRATQHNFNAIRHCHK